MNPLRSIANLALTVGLAALALPLVPMPADAAYPGGNGDIAFVRLAGSDYDIFVLSGGTATNVTQSDPGHDIMPSYSPDGTRIVWSKDFDIWTMDADGSNQQALVTDTTIDGGPSFSPSGKRIVYAADDGSGARLWVTSSTDGSTAQPLGVAGGDPSWSPDGRWIAFQREVPRQGCVCVFKVHPNGTGLTNLSKGIGSSEDEEVDWAPDGSLLVVSHVPSGTSGRQWVVTMRPDGTHRSAVVKDLLSNEFPVFSPSGRKILFSRETTNGNAEHLATVPKRGGAITLLTSGSVTDLGPTWQPT